MVNGSMTDLACMINHQNLEKNQLQLMVMIYEMKKALQEPEGDGDMGEFFQYIYIYIILGIKNIHSGCKIFLFVKGTVMQFQTILFFFLSNSKI